MSGTTTKTGARDAIATWAPLAVSVISLTIFAFAYFIAFLTKDQQTLTLMAGAAIGMATNGMNLWTGKNADSRAKDDRQADLLDRQTEALAASVPAGAAVAPPELIQALRENTAATVGSSDAAKANTRATEGNTDATKPTA